jgi:hypothetical protein
MGAQGIVVRPGEGLVQNFSPGRFLTMKLLGRDTADSVMLFGETTPCGDQELVPSAPRQRRDRLRAERRGHVPDRREVTVGGRAFIPHGVSHAWKSTGPETGRVLFLYAPAKAGGFIEGQHRTERTLASMTESERAEMLQRHGWELLGPSPL